MSAMGRRFKVEEIMEYAMECLSQSMLSGSSRWASIRQKSVSDPLKLRFITPQALAR
jgi:hypothetical protein